MGGTAPQYEVRFSTQAIDDSSFAAATRITVSAPRTGGSIETMTLIGLPTEQQVYVALKTTDGNGNVSALSNVRLGPHARTTRPAPSPT